MITLLGFVGLSAIVISLFVNWSLVALTGVPMVVAASQLRLRGEQREGGDDGGETTEHGLDHTSCGTWSEAWAAAPFYGPARPVAITLGAWVARARTAWPAAKRPERGRR